jgi:hypothetical protein
MAAKSIIEVEVDDSQFEAFKAKFEEYGAQLKEMPGEWGKSESVVDSMSASFERMTAFLLAQQETLQGQRENAEALKKDEDKESKTLSEKSKSMEKIKESTKGIAANIAGATASLLKWVGIGSILTGLAGGGGLFGLDRLAGSVGDARKSAQGLGVTTGEEKAFNLNYDRVLGDPRGLMGSVADAQQDRSRMWEFGAMGISNPQGKEAAPLTLEVIQRAKTIVDQGDGSKGYAEAHGLLAMGFTMEDLRRLHTLRQEELDDIKKKMARDAERFRVDDAVSRQWQEFKVQLGEAGNAIQIAFIKGLVGLIPGLTKLSTEVASFIEVFMGREDVKEFIDTFGERLKAWAEYLGTDEFKGKVGKFIDGVKLLGAEIWAVAEHLKWLIPGDSQGVQDQVWLGGEKLHGVGSGALPSAHQISEAEKDPLVLKQTMREKAIAGMNKFMEYGWTKNQAAGIVAGGLAESKLDPHARGDYVIGRGYTALGAFQWHKDRQDAFKAFSGVDVMNSSLDQQYAYMNYEMLKGLRKHAGDLLKATTTAGGAGIIHSKYVESPLDNNGAEAARRGADAEVLVRIYNAPGNNANVSASQVPR